MAFSVVEEIISKRLFLYKTSVNRLIGSQCKFETKINKNGFSLGNSKLCTYSAVNFYILPTPTVSKCSICSTHDVPVIRTYNTVNSGSSKASNTISVTHIKELLTSHNIEFEDGFTCLITKCPVCNTPQEDGMFINKTTGKFLIKKHEINNHTYT